MDLTNKEITGKAAEKALEKAGITVNKNMVPFDTKSPFVTSGIRIGTPALTTRGMKEEEMKRIGDFIHRVLSNTEDEDEIARIKQEIRELSQDFLLYQEIR